ncbi:DUF2313 domain-containing protein [Brevibacillus agri]|uniref:putative phage tail protein n=1 Tax=Brevibacillus agri TaxID=51101 RepID=UPI002E2076EF|nr:DUF2313 domain-containing protein [Brevibacillus agri]MED1654415.1 DUF2313 domain-containing protein [Brevibacillus agri]MED1688098.1 DUF2313 domain-containing protein [Brevibacillus agri]MED1691172.1 DUF2313 domain-containing protein [Brevibacillus agri]MED1699408.1 DUF2313 domain-containing protein [Brevibacillus agri]
MYSDALLKRLQLFMRGSVVYRSLFEAVAPQYASREEAIADLEAQMSVSTATWGLIIYEFEYGLKTDPAKSLESRRASIIAKMRGAGKFTSKLALAIVSAFTDRVKRVSFTGRIRIHFDDLTDLDLAVVVAALEEVKPAHLNVEYELGHLSALELLDKVTVTLRRYHTFNEFKLGMPFLKYESEVELT